MAATATPGSLPAIDQKGYTHPEMLVSTEWLAAHLEAMAGAGCCIRDG